MTQKLAFDLHRQLPHINADATGFSWVCAAGRDNAVRHLSLSALMICAALGASALAGAAVAQPSLGGDTVSWSASTPAQGAKPGGKVTVTLRGAVQSGWHVYSLQQLPDGPTPLRVTLDAADIDHVAFDVGAGGLWQAAIPVRIMVRDEELELARRVVAQLEL